MGATPTPTPVPPLSQIERHYCGNCQAALSEIEEVLNEPWSHGGKAYRSLGTDCHACGKRYLALLVFSELGWTYVIQPRVVARLRAAVVEDMKSIINA